MKKKNPNKYLLLPLFLGASYCGKMTLCRNLVHGHFLFSCLPMLKHILMETIPYNSGEVMPCTMEGNQPDFFKGSAKAPRNTMDKNMLIRQNLGVFTENAMGAYIRPANSSGTFWNMSFLPKTFCAKCVIFDIF